MKRHLCFAAWLGWAAFAIWACADEPTRSLPTLNTQAIPVPIGDGLLYLGEDNGHPQATLVRVAGEDVHVAIHPLPEGQASSFVRPGSDGREAVLLTTGQRARKDGDAVLPAVNGHVLVFDRGGERARYELAGQYSQLALSDDGRFAVAFSPLPGVTQADQSCVVDLSAPPSGQPVPELALGGTPLWLAFSPPESGRRLAVVAMRDAVTLFDLERPEAAEPLSLPLKLPDDGRQLTPENVLFHGDQIFIRVRGSSDVTVAQLRDAPDTPRGFRVSPFSLASEVEVLDMALIEGSVPQLLAVGPGRARVIDPVTGLGTSTSVPFNQPRLVLFEGSAPLDDEIRPRALLYDPGAREIGFLDLGGAGPWLNTNLERLTLDEPVSELIPLPERKVVVMTHASGFSMVDLEARSVSSVVTGQQFNGLTLDVNGDRAQLWLTDGSERVALVDLAQRKPSELILNAPVHLVVPFGGAQDQVALIHFSQTGHFTLLDADAPARAGAREVVGFAWAQLFN